MGERVDIGHEGPEVYLVCMGKRMNMPPRVAREMAAWLTHNAGLAEEVAERERIVLDEAIMLRTGGRIGLIHDDFLKNEATKEASWNSNLRRYVRTSKQRRPKLGKPAVDLWLPAHAKTAKIGAL